MQPFFSRQKSHVSHEQWPALDQKDSAFSLQADQEGSVQKMAGKFDVCVTGSALSALRRDLERLGQGFMDCLVEKTRVFARVTPDQKEYVVRVLNDRWCCSAGCWVHASASSWQCHHVGLVRKVAR